MSRRSARKRRHHAKREPARVAPVQPTAVLVAPPAQRSLRAPAVVLAVAAMLATISWAASSAESDAVTDTDTDTDTATATDTDTDTATATATDTATATATDTAHELSHDDPLSGIPLRSSPDRPADLAVILSLDGLRPDAIHSGTPAMARLRREGTWAHRARTILNSSTLPSHASMVSGVGSDRHGLDFNGWRPAHGPIRYPTVFRVARGAGLDTTMVVGKRKLQHLVEPDGVARFEVGGIRCDTIVARALPHLRRMREGVAFIHFADPDSAGHRRGWMTPLYRNAVAGSDRCVAQLVEALRPRRARTLLILTADHGGQGRSHGGGREVDRHIPWTAWGAAAAHREVTRPIRTEDTAATVLAALGLPAPRGIEGRPVTEALTPSE